MLHKQAITIINLFQFNCYAYIERQSLGFLNRFFVLLPASDCCYAFNAWELNVYVSHFYIAAKKALNSD